ncbi:LysR family transcriptional regulator [Roseixanthobacter pseudopolyaromaticivorans]|uniref:LysR family transcriptional regulator n=1 Tax=Xanthobacteraceae TaxID=335928 RepID=UPI00372B76BC
MNCFTLRALRTFVTVAECGTISAAAERLGRSQGSVSTTVSEFEAHVGLQLFVRKPAKGLALTPSGELVALEARGLLAHADEFESIAGALGNAVEGELTVGCFTNLAPVVFANIMGSFSARYPSIRIHIEIGDQEEILQGLKSGRIETALTFDLGLSDQFQAVPMASLPAFAVLPENHPLAGRQSVRLGELAPEPMILMDLPHTREYFLSLFYAHGLEPNIRFRSSSFEAVRTLVGNGLGYSILNLKPALSTTYDGTRIVNVPLEDGVRPLKVVLVTLKRIAKRRLTMTFQDFVRGFLVNWSKGQTAAPGEGPS